MRLITPFLLLGGALCAQNPPRHFINRNGPLSERSTEAPRVIADRFLRTIAAQFGLSAGDLDTIQLVKEYRTEHNGVTHFIFRQHIDGIDVAGSEYTVNIDLDGQVLNAGGRLAKPPLQAATPSPEKGAEALRAAMQSVQPEAATSFLPQARWPLKGEKYVRFQRGGIGEELEGKPVWYDAGGQLRPGWTFFIRDGIQVYKVTVDSETNRVVRRTNLTQFQSAPTPRGLVFERQSPQPNPTPGTLLSATPAYVERSLQPFTGDSKASPKGWVTGTETAGNNVIAGNNSLGQVQLTTPVRAVAPDRNFSFPLQLGPGAPNPTNFKDAATVNLFYWMNKAHDLFHALGFDEQAGNYQEENFDRGGVDGDAILAYSQFGIAANASAEMDNAFYLTDRDEEDGARSSINMFLAGSRDDKLFTDGSYDAEVMIHEYTHAVSTRLIRDIRTLQGRAMGEGWSDFFGLEFTLPEGAPADGVYPFAEYLLQDFARGIRSRPYSTDMSINPLTYGQYGRVTWFGPEEHDDGEIWMSALWDARANLIRQFGEREGRRRAALLLIDGMKLAPPSPSMVDMRDAILLADRTTFKGESQTQLWTAFAKRGLGVLAQSTDADTVNVSESRDMPSNKGVLKFYQSGATMGEEIRVALYDGNNTSATALVQLTTSAGDLENVVLRKRGEAYYGSLQSYTDGAVIQGDSALDTVPNDFLSAYYVDADTGSGSQLIQTTIKAEPPYAVTMQTPGSPIISGTERPLLAAISGGRFFPNPIRMTLPFAFPFFGRMHRTVFIAGNGFLTFDVPPYTSMCNDDATLGRGTIIAPLWMELAYGGRAQNNENIYYSTGPDSVTIRWAAETVQTGEPVNVSVVLYSDGRFLFQYGDGNNNLVNSPFFGCSATVPAIAISPGRESFLQRSPQYSGTSYLGRVPSLLWEPPFGYSSFPEVILESPEAGGKYQGILTVRGIAYDNDASIARLDVMIDGVPRQLILPSQSRTDFCDVQLVRGCPNVGFQTSIDLATFGIPPGAHTVQIRATNSRGAVRDFPERPVAVTIEPGQSREPEGVIETPANGASITGTSPVRGYVYASDLRILSVDVIVDGVTYGQALYGLPRTDVCNALPNRPPNCPNIGFSFTLNSMSGQVQLPNGKHTLQVRARDESGRFTLITAVPLKITVANSTSEAPQAVLSTPQPNARLKGAVLIYGYAWDPDGRVQTVELLVDSVVYQTLSYGAARTSECAALPDLPGCPDIGFEGYFDTMLVSNGLHTLEIRVRDNNNRTTLVPRTALNVYVEN